LSEAHASVVGVQPNSTRLAVPWLSLGKNLCQRHGKALHLRFDRIARVARDDDDLVDAMRSLG